MAAVEVPQTFEYKGGQLNAAPILEVENFTNWKKWFMCHIVGIEPQFENIISNGPYIPMEADDQMNSVIYCLTTKSTWDDLILYHEGPFDVKESRVMDLKLCYNTFKFKEGESLTQTFTKYKALMNELVNDGIKLSKLEINIGFINGLPKKWLTFFQSLRNTNHVKESELASLFGKLKYEENLINSIYDTNKEKTLVPATPLSTAFFSTSIIQDSQDSPNDEEYRRSSQEYMNDLEEEYQARALLAKSKRFFKNDEEEVSSNDNEVPGVKALMALADKERVFVSKESVKNGECIKISMKKCIIEQIPTQKKKILGIDQLTEDTSSSGPKDPVFVKSSADNSKVSVTGSNKPKLSEAEDFTLSNRDTGKHPLPPLEKLTGVEPVSGPKTIKSILKSKSTFKAETLKGIIINEPSSAPARGNKSSLVSKTNSAPIGPEGMSGNHYTYITEGYGYGIVFKKGGKVNVPQHEH
ncbi:hypothetical protein Tco_0237698 [Tanacetum coccineum]